MERPYSQCQNAGMWRLMGGKVTLISSREARNDLFFTVSFSSTHGRVMSAEMRGGREEC